MPEPLPNTDLGNAPVGTPPDSAQKAQLRKAFGIQDEIISVLTTAERKTLTTYDPDGPVVGQTRVIQTDLPGILWNLVGADVTLDSSWIGIPYTVDPDGNVVVNLQITDTTGTTLPEGALGYSSQPEEDFVFGPRRRLFLGDGRSIEGISTKDSRLPAGFIRIRAHRITNVEFFSSSGFIAMQCPDGSVSIHQSGDGFDVPLQFRSSGLRDFLFWSCESAILATPAGNITRYSRTSSGVTDITEIEMGEGAAEALTRVQAYAALGNAYMFDTSRLTNCSILVLYDNFNLRVIDLSGAISLTRLELQNCPNLERVIPPAQFLVATPTSHALLYNSNLTKEAIEELLHALPVLTTPTAYNYVRAENNPGSATADPTIATSKGWNVIL